MGNGRTLLHPPGPAARPAGAPAWGLAHNCAKAAGRPGLPTRDCPRPGPCPRRTAQRGPPLPTGTRGRNWRRETKSRAATGDPGVHASGQGRPWAGGRPPGGVRLSLGFERFRRGTVEEWTGARSERGRRPWHPGRPPHGGHLRNCREPPPEAFPLEGPCGSFRGSVSPSHRTWGGGWRRRRVCWFTRESGRARCGYHLRSRGRAPTLLAPRAHPAGAKACRKCTAGRGPNRLAPGSRRDRRYKRGRQMAPDNKR